MLYKFKSKAGADVIMMGPHGDELLRLIGKSPSAQGILQAADLPAAIQALEAAAAQAGEAPGDDASGETAEASESAQKSSGAVSLRQRVWPMVELMRRASAEGHDIVWGV